MNRGTEFLQSMLRVLRRGKVGSLSLEENQNGRGSILAGAGGPDPGRDDPNVADDVKISIKGFQTDITIIKKLA